MLRTPIYPKSDDFQSKLCFDKEITILTGETFSDAIDLGGASIIAISIPATFVGDYLYFYIWDGENYKKAYSPDLSAVIEMRMRVVADSAYPMVATDGAAFQFLKLKSDIVQTSDVILKLVLRNLA